jgi:transposase-like protein
MKYQDKAESVDIEYALNQVHSIFQIEIPETEFEKIETKELVELNQKIKDCELQMKLLSDYLEHKGYSQASTYVANARNNLFTYLRFWMKTGVVTPKVTSKLERLMREINRRIKKFAFNWSEKGCAKITRIIIKLITDASSWENYWVEKMRFSGNIKLSFMGIS